ncbi:MAG: hypothetical protein ACK4KW_07900 [Gemmobacter sp.]
MLAIADPVVSNAAPDVLQSQPDTRAVPTLRLHRRLCGSNSVARGFVASERAPDAAAIAAALEAHLLQIMPACSANVGLDVQPRPEQDGRRGRSRERVPAPTQAVDRVGDSGYDPATARQAVFFVHQPERTMDSCSSSGPAPVMIPRSSRAFPSTSCLPGLSLAARRRV